MSEKKANEVNQSLPLKDDQIVTERRMPRRSFLTATGAILAGAAAIVAGTRATSLLASPQSDPDSKKGKSDPDKKKKKKMNDPDKKKEKGSDPDKKKQ